MRKLFAIAFLIGLWVSQARADSTINALAAGGALSGGELIPMFQSSNPAKTTTPTAIGTYLTGTGNFVPSARTISTTSPLAGGGSLAGNLTLSIGNIPVTNLNSGAGASGATFWRGDGTWAVPGGSGGLSGMTAGSIPVAATPTTVTSSILQSTWLFSAAGNSTLAGSGVRCLHADNTGTISIASGDCATGGSGSVTSISQGTGMSFSVNPITTTGTINLGNTAVTPGSYTNTNLTVTADGRITAAANGSGGGGTSVLSYGTIAGGPAAYTIASPTPAVSSNVANYSVLASIPTSVTKNTGAATLAVGTATALPLQVNTSVGSLAFAGGEFVGNDTGGGETQVLLKLNSGATAWVLMSRPGGGTTVNPSAHTITQSEWANSQVFLCTSACSLTLPNLATTTLSSNAGPTVVTVGAIATITSLGTDGVNNGQVGGIGTAGTFYIPADMTAPLFTSGALGAAAYTIPIGTVQYFPFSWIPGQDLSTATAGVRVGRFATPRILYAIRCNLDLAAGAAQTMVFRDQTATGTIAAGTLLNSGSFNMNGTPGTEVNVTLTATPLLIPTDYWIGAVVTGSATAGSGACQFTYR